MVTLFSRELICDQVVFLYCLSLNWNITCRAGQSAIWGSKFSTAISEVMGITKVVIHLLCWEAVSASGTVCFHIKWGVSRITWPFFCTKWSLWVYLLQSETNDDDIMVIKNYKELKKYITAQYNTTLQVRQEINAELNISKCFLGDSCTLELGIFKLDIFKH